MKSVWRSVFCLVLLAGIGLAVSAADRTNEEQGYFENTRTVLLFDAQSEKQSGAWAARRMDRELSAIFRYPYYRTLDGAERNVPVKSPEALRAEAVSAGADIAVQPVAVRFEQHQRYPVLFSDGDPLVTTMACLRLVYWEDGMEQTRTIETRFFDSRPEGMDTEADRIFDAMWAKLMKQFPYRRVPVDRSRNLSGAVELRNTDADEGAREVSGK